LPKFLEITDVWTAPFALFKEDGACMWSAAQVPATSGSGGWLAGLLCKLVQALYLF